ncbi:Prophage protein [Lactiplantibacillus plantarum]|nr:Prophage protein [Lactiplantibacillus plantarum]MCG0880119.1 Prophage protein [Lactiplantibacillus plantarum]
MVEHDITWSIHNRRKVPKIYVDGEQAQVVSCSYQFVTATDIDESGVSMMTATIILLSERDYKPIQHVIFINQQTSKVFYQ